MLRIGELSYVLSIAVSFYLLYSSRTGEANVVWQVMHPAFIPILVVATSILVAVLLSVEKTSLELLFTISHSILVHSFFSVIFPAGDLSGQQIILGRTQLIYSNVIRGGWPPWTGLPMPSLIVEWLKGINFQAALTVVFARMLGIDVYWVHLFLVPVLWGIFTSIAAYLTTFTLTRNGKISAISSLLFSAFPLSTYFGAISVPNSLGFIFFFYSLYFMIRSLNSSDIRTTILTAVFVFFSFLGHYLAGVIGLSFLLLTLAYRSYGSDRQNSKATSKVTLAICFLVSSLLLPFSLIYLRLFQTANYTMFTLGNLYGVSLDEIARLFLLGELAYSSSLGIIFLFLIGPTVALLSMLLLIHRIRRTPNLKLKLPIYFIFTAFLVLLIDYGILKLFMTGLPLNEERIWVFRDFVACPFLALTLYKIPSQLSAWLKTSSALITPTVSLKVPSKRSAVRILGLLFALNVIVPLFVGGWVTASLSAAYPQVASLQTTCYELDAVKYIEQNAQQKYVVIGDIWTIFAGEVIVGINNPNAYYFGESDKLGHDLFVNMSRDPSPKWMLSAMNYTQAKVAYFVVTQPRVGTAEFNMIVSQVAERNQLTVDGVFGNGKLCVFSYRSE